MIFAMDIMELMAELTSERKLDIFCMCGSFFSQIGHCSLLWNSGTLTLNNVFNDSDVTPQYGTDSTSVRDKSTCLVCKGKN